MAAGDGRPSIAERYASREDYEAKVRAAAESLVAQRFLLASDIETSVANAGALWRRIAGE
jgi:hypothetical protein